MKKELTQNPNESSKFKNFILLARKFRFPLLYHELHDRTIEGVRITEMINDAYQNLRKRVGKQKADELMRQFEKDAMAGREANHEYIISKMNSHGC